MTTTAIRTMLIENKKPVGVKKVSNWKLPPNDFAYGKKIPSDKEDASVSKEY